MQRREFLEKSAALGMMTAIPSAALRGLTAGLDAVKATVGADTKKLPAASPLSLPARGGIPVAFLISRGAVVIDFCGPWEVFQDVSVPGRAEDAFHLYTVAEASSPVPTSGGMTIVPNYTLRSAPAPKVIVIPAQSGRSEAMLEWIRKSARSADLTMSVCTGAFLLAKTGLLSGKAATTHHASYREFAMQFPDVHLKRGARFVEEGNLATAGGLSSGIDLALHVVERYYGHDVAEKTAYQMEYQGQGWTDPNSNEVYARERASTADHPLCPVCEMEVDPATAPRSVYAGKTYFFCSQGHKDSFDATPAAFIDEAGKR